MNMVIYHRRIRRVVHIIMISNLPRAQAPYFIISDITYSSSHVDLM